MRSDDSEEEIPFYDREMNADVLASGSQAIVTSYYFQCCGDVTAWMTHVQPGGGRHDDGQYSITFQVWRPSPTVGSDGTGCYSLVGQNPFISITRDEFTSRVISATPEPTNIISVQPGDVVGYYAVSEDGGRQGIQHDSRVDSILVFYNENQVIQGPDSCPISVGLGGALSSSLSAAPLLTAIISKSPH